MKTCVLVLLLLSSVCLSAQDWQPFNFNQGYYLSLTPVNTPEPTVSIAGNAVISLTLDSITNDSQSTMYWPLQTLGCDGRDYNSTCYDSWGYTCSDVFSWTGRPVTKTGAHWTTTNRFGNTVALVCPLNGSDTILEIGDTVYKAAFVGMAESEFLGGIDSIATYLIEVSDSNGPLAGNVWHLDTLVISKTYGFIQTPSWYLFPRHESWFRLIDHSGQGSLGGLHPNTIYGYEAGDIICTYSETEDADYSAGNWTAIESHIKLVKQCTVTQVDNSSARDKYEMSCRVQEITEHYASEYPYMRDSVTGKVYDNTETWESPVFTDGLFWGPRLSVTKQDSLVYLRFNELAHYGHSSDTCPWVQDVYQPDHQRRETFIQGIGRIDYNAYQLYGYPTGSYSTQKGWITYFKSGEFEYGTPQWFIGMEDIKQEDVISVYPNPFDTRLEIHSQSPLLNYGLYDQLGRVVYPPRSFAGYDLVLETSGLPAGIYTLMIGTSRGTHFQKLIKY